MATPDLTGKKVGYYVGSFDPFHYGHQNFVDTLLAKDFVDYIFIYPVPGGDIYKTRVPFELRCAMIAPIYASNPRVIVLDCTPAQLQHRLAPYLGKMEIIGIVGSDVVTTTLLAPDLEVRRKYQSMFMRGLPVTEKHAADTVGALMALRADSFLVNLREGADLSHLNGMIEDRPIRAFIQLDPPYSHISSTELKKVLKSGPSIAHMAAPSVRTVIEQHHLYT